MPVRFVDKQLKTEGSGENDEMCVYRFTYSMTVPLESWVRATADTVTTRQRITVLHKAMELIVWLMQDFELKRCFVKNKVFAEWRCVPLLVLC